MQTPRIWLAAAMAAGVAASGFAQGTESVVKLPGEIEYKPVLGPGTPPLALLYGDPRKPGLYVVRAKFPAGFKIMPHSHPDERTAVILSGTLHFGIGEQWDESKLKSYPAGTFLTEPPSVPHFAWAKDGEVVIQVTGVGPSGTTEIAPRQ
jgi:quercetin dioxygenase-like cupin family protein